MKKKKPTKTDQSLHEIIRLAYHISLAASKAKDSITIRDQKICLEEMKSLIELLNAEKDVPVNNFLFLEDFNQTEK